MMPLVPFSALFPIVLSVAVSAMNNASPTASGVPTYPADATALTAVSAILATATPEPNLGNPADLSNYPLCAQICANETAQLVGCDLENIECVCGTAYRNATAACEEISCSALDRATVSLLGQEICDPVYQNIPSLGSAVSSAVAAATSLAAAQLSKDPTKSASFPLCAQICQNASLPSSGCGSLSNRACVCTSPTLTDINTCELKTCSASDFQITSDLADALCNPVGGILNTTNTTSNASYSFTSSTPVPTAFTGGSTVVMKGVVGWIVVGLGGMLSWQVLL